MPYHHTVAAMGNAAGASYLLDMLANGLVLFDALYRNHGISGLCGELYELADRIAPALTRTLAHGKTLVSISERRLHSVLAALEKCLIDQGFRVGSGAGVGAAVKSYSQAEAAVVASR